VLPPLPQTADPAAHPTRSLDWATDGRSWPHHAASRFVAAGGLRWHVQVLGQGPALWLLHGTGAASHSWRHLLPLLAARHTLVVPDLPGHGFSGRLPAAQQSLPGSAAALAALAQALALPPTAVAGHSAGAALAVRSVLDGHWPAVPLLGINAALLPFAGVAGQVLGPIARLLASQPLLPWWFARRARDGNAVRRLVAATGSTLDAEGLALYARLLRSPAHLAGALAMMSDWDLRALWAELPRLASPLCLLVGSADATVPPAQAQQVARRLHGTQVQVLPALGHLAHEEAPALVAALLQRWLCQAGAVQAGVVQADVARAAGG